MSQPYKLMNILMCIICFFGMASYAAAEEPLIFSMEKSVAYALKHSPILLSSEIAVKQTDEDIKSARGAFLPSVSASWSMNAISSLDSEGPSDSDYLDQKYGVTGVKLTQRLFSGFEYINRYKKAKLGKEYEAARLESQKNDLKREVESTFLELLKNRYDISVIFKGITNLESDLSMAKAFSARKLVPYLDVLQAEADLEYARQNLEETQTAVFRYAQRLNRLLGISRKGNIESVKYIGNFEHEPIEFSLSKDQCVILALENRIEPQLLKLEIKMAGKDAAILKSKFYPRVDFSAGLSETNRNYSDLGVSSGQAYDRDQENLYWEAGVYVKWDIFNGGTDYHQVRKSNLEIKKLEIDLKQVEMEITEEVSVSYKLIYSTRNKLGAIGKIIIAAEESYEREQKRFKAKLISLSDLLAAQAQLFKAETLLSQALLEHKISMVKLNHAMGITN